ncbi:MAG TPA: dienelactone hydrolase family protein [Candidatus Paceibacterota bacterium]|nr:dienelactone hydrolase family protein [Candidatus Paceibacterota bacterium]
MSFSLTQAQPATGQQPAVRSWANDPRVQSRTYVFTNTDETLPYAVFVSTKVTKDKPAPLIVALRGAGGNPGVFMHEPALKLAEAGGYIMVAPMGYSAMANFGNPATGMGGFGRRGGAPTNAPGMAPQMQGANQSPGGVSPSKASEYSEQDVMNVLAIIRKEFNIDDHRIYLMGHSQGGAGALHIADKYSSIWAAVAGLSPGAPGFQLDANAKFKDVAVLIMVGDKDGFIGSVQRLDERMKSLNIPHEYIVVPGKDHGGIIMGGMPEVFKFFGQHTRP